jgi:hypothetical protein
MHNRRGFAIKKSKKRVYTSFSLIALHHFAPAYIGRPRTRLLHSILACGNRPSNQAGLAREEETAGSQGRVYNSVFNGIPGTRFGLV